MREFRKILERLSGAPRLRNEPIPDLATIAVEKPVRVEATLEHIAGRWLLRVPLATGGDKLALYTRGTSEIKGEVLEVKLPENLVRNLGLRDGQHLWIHNEGGRFSFEWKPEQ